MANTEFLSFALELAAAAASEIVPRFQACDIKRKDDGSVVTDADCAAEREICRRIRARFPSHGIIGEEEGVSTWREHWQWVVDPIDGTMSYSLGVAKFGTLIALLEAKKPILGVVHLPMTRESLYAETGHGCWYARNGKAAQQVWVDTEAENICDARISLSGVDDSELRGKTARWRLSGLLNRAHEVEFIGDCVQYTLVARGHVHAALDSRMYPWDSAAVVPCILEAGGVVSTLDGRYDEVTFGGSLLASGNRRLHEEILNLING